MELHTNTTPRHPSLLALSSNRKIRTHKAGGKRGEERWGKNKNRGGKLKQTKHHLEFSQAKTRDGS